MGDCDESMIIVIDARPGVTVPAFRRSCRTRVNESTTEPLPSGDGQSNVEDSTVILQISSSQLETTRPLSQSTGSSASRRFPGALSHLSIDANPDAFVAVDLDNRIVNWNEKSTALFGWSKEEAIGQ